MIQYIAIDFDNTICEPAVFPAIGGLKPYALTALTVWRNMGKKIIIHTCRNGEALQLMVEWLRVNCVPYDYINTNPERPTGGPKPMCDIYIDDRGYRFIDWFQTIRDFQELEETTPEHIFIP